MTCPSCGSNSVYKDGLRYLSNGETVQRRLCRNCGHRFSECSIKLNIATQISKVSDSGKNHTDRRIARRDLTSKEVLDSLSFNGSEDIGAHNVTIVEKGLNALRIYNRERRVCALNKKAKNLDQATETKTVAGKSPIDQQTLKGKLLEFEFWMQKQGYAEPTVKHRVVRLKMLARRGANILDPESVKNVIALQKSWGDGTKANVVDTYSCFLEKEGLTWTPPRYKRQETIPFIPSEAELNMLIGASGKTLSIFLQGLKETGADPGELAAITSKDVNKEARIITLNHPVKGHRPRILTVSQDLINRLETIANDSGRYFNADQLRRAFLYKRRTTVRKLSNPRLQNITFITFRHWFGTMEYHRTKDILHVQRLLGHKNIQNTLIYIDLETKLFSNSNEGFTTRVAQNTGEACGLIEAGFEYVTGQYHDGGKIFKKRK
jgi:integrase